MRFGPYEVVDELGRGGMGVVYRARDGRGVEVAVKAAVDGSARRVLALEQEAALLVAIDHPSVPRVLHSAVEEQPPWYAMELIEGQTLREFWDGLEGAVATRPTQPTVDGPGAAPTVAGRVADWRERLEPLGAVCAAVAALHAADLVHGDLKPSNLVIRNDRRAALVDFGLAMRVGDRETHHGLAASTAPSGTPGYVAPERLRGETVDARADVYSLGCLIHEALTGAPPHAGAPAREVIHRRAIPVRSWNPDAPAELAELVDRVLDPDPERRPGQARSLARVLGDRSSPTQPAVFRPGLVGREAELASLVAALDGLAASPPVGRSFLVRGPAGCGKTRLAIELASRARLRGVRVVAGACAATDAPEHHPLGAFSRLLQRAARHPDPQRVFGHHLRLLARSAPILREVPGYDEASEPEEVPPELGRRVLVDALVGVAAALGPLVLVVDDLHWADAVTLEVLDRLADPSHGVLVLATSRPMAEEPDFEVVDLPPLGPDAVARVVARMLAQPEPLPGLGEGIHRLGEGSPFVVGQAVRWAVQRGVLVHREGAWVQAAGLPTTAEALLQERLDGLPDGDRAVLGAAALLGLSGTPSALGAVTGLPRRAVVDATLRLARADLLTRSPEGAVAPAHDRIGRAAYAGVADVQGWHRRAAATLEGVGRPEEVADHWWAAGDRERAQPLYLEAGRDAVRRFALEQAERHLGRAIEVGGELGLRALLALTLNVLAPLGRAGEAVEPLRAHLHRRDALGLDVRLILATAYRVSRGFAEGEAVAEECLELAREQGNREAESWALAQLALFAQMRADLERSMELVQAGLAIPEHRNSGRASSLLYRQRILSAWHLGRTDQALAWAQEYVDDLEGGPELPLGGARFLLGMMRMDNPETTHLAERELTLSLETCIRSGDRRGAALCASNLAEVHHRRGDMDEALRQTRWAASELRAFDDLRSAVMTELNLVELLVECARYDELLPVLDRCIADLEQMQEPNLPRACAIRARVIRLTDGDPEEAASWLRRGDTSVGADRAVYRVYVVVEWAWHRRWTGADLAPVRADLDAIVAELANENGEVPDFLKPMVRDAEAALSETG